MVNRKQRHSGRKVVAQNPTVIDVEKFRRQKPRGDRALRQHSISQQHKINVETGQPADLQSKTLHYEGLKLHLPFD